MTHHLLRLPPGDPNDYAWYNDLALYYTKGGALHMVINDRWKLSDPNDPTSFDDYEKLSAREFGYDNPQARWLDRDVSTSTYAPGAGAQHWTDSLGVAPYLDFECTPPVDPNDPNELPVVSGVTRYLAASAQQTLDGEGEPLETRYYHGDLIDSTCLTTDDAGTPNSGGGVVSTVAYTAFGQVISANGEVVTETPGGGFPRYQFAGGYRYESGLIVLAGADADLPVVSLKHLGARWYDSNIGRFVQRDPIGLFGGLNSYVYSLNGPLTETDATGTYPTCGTPGVSDPNMWWGWWPKGYTNTEFFLDCTGGPRRSFLDRLNGRVEGRCGLQPGVSSGTGAVGAGRYFKQIRTPGQTATSSAWRMMLRQWGLRGVADRVALGGGIAAGVGAFIDLYILGQECIFAYYDIPPGEY